MRRALVLGGGGFFGAFQAGVYESLEPFDCVTGVSAGALNAWAIASGMPPAELQRLWVEAAGSARAGLRVPRYFGDGFLEAGRLEGFIRRLVSEWRPRIDLGVVVNQGWNCRSGLIRNEEIDAATLLASCAVPLLLPAQRIGGRLSYDGGIRDACPLWTGAAMGAEETVGINVWTHLPFWWPGRRVRESRRQSGITVIEPAQRLGPLRASALATRSQVEMWIEAGRQTAKAAFSR